MNSVCGGCRPARHGALVRLAIVCLLASFWPIAPTMAQQTEPLPTFEQLEAEGAIIGEILIDNQNIFDLTDPRENNIFFRAANALHIRTRAGVVRRQLLFKSGDPVSVQQIEETERNLRDNAYLYEVQIRPVAYQNGVVDVEIVSRDTWSLDPGLGFSRKGGENTSKYGLKELNLIGTGAGIEWQREEAERGTTDSYQFNNDLILGTRARFNFTYVNGYNDTGQFATLERPFYKLDARWAAGVSGSATEQLVSTYSNNILTSQYRRERRTASVFGGWSKGLVDNWTRRYSLGLDYLEDKNELVAGAPPPSQLPIDEVRVSPFVRFGVIQDRFVKTKNRDQVERPEFFLLGFASDIKLGYAATGLGSTRPAWSYAASISNGWDLSRDRILTAAFSAAGLYADGDDQDQLLTGAVQYYVPQSKRAQTYLGLKLDAASDVTQTNQLSLGGESGLPGYPANYQTGDRRALLNVEQRLYSDWYPFRLFRVGGAVFFDAGRAWGGEIVNTEEAGWLANVGFGLRIFSVRSAFGTVWRLDVAVPIDPQGDIPSYQIQFYRTVGF